MPNTSVRQNKFLDPFSCLRSRDPDYDIIPFSTISSLYAYVEERRRTGGFLYSFLTHDMVGVFDRADNENSKALRGIWKFIYNNLPASCHGSEEKVEAWLASKDQ